MSAAFAAGMQSSRPANTAILEDLNSLVVIKATRGSYLLVDTVLLSIAVTGCS
jgi:hypothetical protein